MDVYIYIYFSGICARSVIQGRGHWKPLHKAGLTWGT